MSCIRYRSFEIQSDAFGFLRRHRYPDVRPMTGKERPPREHQLHNFMIQRLKETLVTVELNPYVHISFSPISTICIFNFKIIINYSTFKEYNELRLEMRKFCFLKNK